MLCRDAARDTHRLSEESSVDEIAQLLGIVAQLVRGDVVLPACWQENGPVTVRCHGRDGLACLKLGRGARAQRAERATIRWWNPRTLCRHPGSFRLPAASSDMGLAVGSEGCGPRPRTNTIRLGDRSQDGDRSQEQLEEHLCEPPLG